MKIIMNETRTAVINVLKGASAPMTLAEIAAAIGAEKIATGTTNAMLSAGMIVKAGKTKVAAVGTRSVATYKLNYVPGEDTKVAMNDTRKAIVAALQGATAPMTLAEIAAAIGVEKINPGVISPMLTAEVMSNVGTTKVPTQVSRNVDTYVIGNIAD